MKTILLIAFTALLCCAQQSYAAFTIAQTAITIEANSSPTSYSGSSNPDALTAFNSSYLGNFNSASSLLLQGGFVRSTVSGSSQMCSGTLFYRIYLQGTTPGTFQSLNLATFTSLSATSKRWSATSANINLLSGINSPGVYYIDTYWTATGHATTTACTTTFTENNSGAYFTSSFDYSIKDSFSDGNFSSSPVWSGDTGSFTYNATSDVTTTSATNSRTVRLNAAAAGTFYMSTPQTNWNQDQTWSFWIGRRAQAYSNTDNISIWLYANESNLESATVDGYRLSIGDNTGVDELVLQSVTNNTGTAIITSSGGITNNVTDAGIAVEITRTSAGVWTLYTSAFPTANGGGVNANTNPINSATTNVGSVTNTTYTPTGTGYLGFVAVSSASANARATFEFDNLYFGALPTFTCPGNQTVNLGSGCTANLADYVSSLTLSNNCLCNGTLTITQTPVAGTLMTGPGTTPVTITLTSSLGLSSVCNFNVTREDNTPPTLTCPANITVYAEPGVCGAFVDYSAPTYTDNCGSCAPSSIAGYTSIGTYNGHTYFRSNTSVTWTAANAAANALGAHLVTFSNSTEADYFNSLGQHWIGLSDETTEGLWQWVTGEPVSYTNWNAGEPNNAGEEDYCIANWAGNAWNDWTAASTAPYIIEYDCVNIPEGKQPGSLFPIGITTVSCTAVDAYGNTSVPCSFTVTVIDNAAPVLSCPSNITVAAGAGNCSAAVTYSTPTAIDNCSSCSSAPAIAGYTSLGVYQGKAYYMSNSAASVDAAIIACQNAGGQLATISTVADNNFVRSAATTAGIGNYLVGLNDMANEGTFVWPSGLPVTFTNWNAGEPNNYGAGEDFVEVYTNGMWNDISGTGRYILEKTCLTVVRTAGQASGSSFPIGTTTITHSSTDASGNIGTCSFTITVTGNNTPTLSCPADQALSLGIAGSVALPDYRSLATLTTPCVPGGSSSLIQTPAIGTTINTPGNLSITLTYNSPLGITLNCNFNVVVTNPTKVFLSGTSGNYNETSGTFSIPVSLENPSPTASTTVQLAISSGNAASINNFSTQTITFPAGSNTSQNVSVTITDNLICEGTNAINFILQNVSGGNLSYIGTANNYQVSIADNDAQSTTWLDDNFELGTITNWTQNSVGSWIASNVNPNSGSYSLRHNISGAPGVSWASTDLDKQILQGLTTTWKFNLNHFLTDPASDDNFLVYLSSSSSNLNNAQLNGYALGVSPANSTEPDYVNLYRIENGVIAQTIINSAFDWNTLHAEVGFEITRNESGLWMIRIDDDGDFNNLVSYGSATDNTFKELSYFGLKYTHTASTAGKLSIDDITISSIGCPCTWYSQQSGNSTGSIWAKTIIGTAQIANFSNYDNFIIQSGHQVSLSGLMTTNNITISPTAVFDLGSQDLFVFGNLSNSGAIVSGPGTIHFKGNAAQSISSSNNISLSNVNIDNDGYSVVYSGTGEMMISGAIRVDEGTFDSGNKVTLISSASSSAAIGTISNSGDFIGDITLQRYIPAMGNYTYGSYIGFGCPLLNQTITDWNDDIVTSGFIGSDYPPPYSFTNIYWYNEAATGSVGNGYMPVTSIDESIHHDKGYFVYLQTPSQMIDVKGEIQKHSFDTYLSYTNSGNATDDGWNLLLNQYPSEVDFRQLANNGSGVSSYSLFDAESNNYKAYNAFLNIGTASRYIAASQSFFAKASAPGAYLHYDETYKTAQGVAFERSGEEEENDQATPHVIFEIISTNGSSDQSILAFNSNSTYNFDLLADVLKINSSDNLATELALQSADQQLLTINCIPFGDAAIPVHVELPTAGNYTFKINSTHDLPENFCMWVEDLVTGTSIPVVSGQQITLNTSAAFSGNRLLIHTLPSVLLTNTNVVCFGDNTAELSVVGSSDSWLSIYDPMGNEMYSGSAPTQLSTLSAGIYSVSISYQNNVCATITKEVEIHQPEPSTVSLTDFEPDHCNESNNGSFVMTIQSPTEYNFSLTNYSGVIIDSGTSLSQELSYFGLSHGNYEIQIDNGCEIVTVPVNVSDPMAVVADISSAESLIDITGENDHFVLIEQNSQNATSFYWSLDNGAESTESSFGYEFEESGQYTLMLIASNDVCSSSDFIQINVSETLTVVENEELAFATITNTSETIAFTLNQTHGETSCLMIYDLNGKLISKKSSIAHNGSIISEDITNYAAGIYQAVLTLNNKPLVSHKFYCN